MVFFRLHFRLFKGVELSFAMAIALLLFSVSPSQALPLKDFPSQPQFSFDPSQDHSVPECSEIFGRVEVLRKVVDESQYSLISFMEQSAQVIEAWHADLHPLEGKTSSLPRGLFSPLSEGASSIYDLSGLAYENADYVSREFEKLSEALYNCIPQQGD